MLTDTLLYVSIYICVCIVGFDLMVAAYLSRAQRMMPKMKKQVVSLLDEQLKHIERDGTPDEELQQAIYKGLLSEEFLLAFIAVIEKRGSDARDYSRYLCLSISLFARLTKDYERKNDEYKALFAHAISTMKLGSLIDRNDSALAGELSSIAEYLMPQVMNPSIYVRENTLKAIVSLGNTSSVLGALALLNSEREFTNEKLLSDDLLEFTGDVYELMSQLWYYFDQLSSGMKETIINYMRLLPREIDQKRYYEDIRKLLLSKEADGDVRIAAIRYFRKRIYDKVYDDLLALLSEQDSRGYDFPAIAATSLQSYPGKTTEDALMHMLSDQDWYVRFNSAESLIALGVDYEKAILESSDRYAKEMLIYRSEVYKLKNRNVVDA